VRTIKNYNCSFLAGHHASGIFSSLNHYPGPGQES
jgi:hypothetical protein